MRDDELLCEIEMLENRVCRLETEKMDIMLANGNNKSKLKLKTDTIKKQNVKLKKLQQQLDQQKAMWNELKEWVKLQIDGLNEQLVDYDFDSDCRDISIDNFEIMLQQMQELEGEDE